DETRRPTVVPGVVDDRLLEHRPVRGDVDVREVLVPQPERRAPAPSGIAALGEQRGEVAEASGRQRADVDRLRGRHRVDRSVPTRRITTGTERRLTLLGTGRTL